MLGLYLPTETKLVPLRNKAHIFSVRLIIAENAVLCLFDKCVGNFIGNLEIHIRNPHRNDVGRTVVLDIPGCSSIMYGVKIIFHNVTFQAVLYQ